MTYTTVQLWNSRLIVSDADAERLTDFILEHLTRTRAGRESVSHMVATIRERTRYNFPTKNVDAQTMFEALGFKLEHTRAKTGRAGPTYVTL